MRMSALFGAKNTEFFEIYYVSTRTRGEASADKGEWSIFCDFVRTSFMDV